MKFQAVLTNKKLRILTIILLILLLFFCLFPHFTSRLEPVDHFLITIFNYYYLLSVKLANHVLLAIGSSISINNHFVVQNNIFTNQFFPGLRFKYWMILFITLVWITKSSIIRRVLFTLLLIVVHILFNSIYLIVGALWTGAEHHNYSLPAIPLTLGYLGLTTIFFLWFRLHKESFLSSLTELKINGKFFENDFHILAIVYFLILIKYFVFEFFDFHILIKLLFSSAQKILALSGYVAYVESNILGGTNGSIYMSRDCLGFHTMFLFALVIFFTGNNNLRCWIFIVTGLLVLNLANIIRFVLLFIHIQKNGGYNLAVGVHDIYNYIIYLLVFVLWIIWFRKFAIIK
jgi:exosortase/archaeosortase family protein